MTNALLLLLPFLLFLASLLMIELGYQRRLSSAPAEGAGSASSAVATMVLSLMGLVLAFTFSNAAGRLDASRLTILDEVNAISTTWQRIDVAEPEVRDRLRHLLRQYLDTRVRAYAVFSDPTEYQRELKTGAELREQLWRLAVEGTTISVNRTLLLTGINEIGNSAAVRTLSLGTHLPTIVIGFLVVIVLIGSLLIGSTLGTPGDRRWLDRLIVAGVLSVIVYAIMDMEYPRLGTRLLAREDAMLLDLRKTMQ